MPSGPLSNTIAKERRINCSRSAWTVRFRVGVGSERPHLGSPHLFPSWEDHTVVENPTTSWNGGSPSGNSSPSTYTAGYLYDALDDLLGVSQAARLRAR